MCKRGDIYYADFGEDITTNKQQGIRPVVIISNNRANEHSPVITVVPMTARTSKKRYLPTHVLIPRNCGTGLDKDSLALAEQLTPLDKNKLREKRGCIQDPHILGALTRAIQIQIGMDERYN